MGELLFHMSYGYVENMAVQEASPSVEVQKPSGGADKPVRIWVEIRISNGLHLSRIRPLQRKLFC